MDIWQGIIEIMLGFLCDELYLINSNVLEEKNCELVLLNIIKIR